MLLVKFIKRYNNPHRFLNMNSLKGIGTLRDKMTLYGMNSYLSILITQILLKLSLFVKERIKLNSK